MARKMSIVAAVVLVTFCKLVAHAQRSSITLAAIDGRSGKAMPHQRLLVFMGSSQQEVRSHALSANVTTDEHGHAVLLIPPRPVHWIQVFADFQTLCQSDPNENSFGLEKVLSKGENTPNTCSSFREELKPGQLTVFARPATFREKTAW